MAKPRIRKSRASSSDEARRYRQQGHDDALLFALAIGLNEDYKNDTKAKKDVIDLSGDAHSVKSGEKKWQIINSLQKRQKYKCILQILIRHGKEELTKIPTDSLGNIFQKEQILGELVMKR